MKHGKRPTVEQKKHIAAFRLNPENWLVCKDTLEEMVLIHRMTERIRRIPGRMR